MTKYFDKDFFKFTMGFLAIIALSLLIIILTKQYINVTPQTANVINSVPADFQAE